MHTVEYVYMYSCIYMGNLDFVCVCVCVCMKGGGSLSSKIVVGITLYDLFDKCFDTLSDNQQCT